MRKIRTTLLPEQEIEVTEQSLLDLSRQGLVLEVIEDAPPAKPKGTRRAAERSLSADTKKESKD